MVAKLKVDQLETVDGTGIITVNNPLAGDGSSLTALDATALTGNLPALSGASLTALNATNLGSGTVPTARLGTGTADADSFLRGDGAWAEAGGGKILQVVSYQRSGNFTTTSSSFVNTNLYVSITPASTDNKILIMITCGIDPGGSGAWGTITRNGVNVTGHNEGFCTWGSGRTISTLTWPDSPNTTSAITYRFQVRSGGGTTIEIPPCGSSKYSIIAIEVAG